MAEGLFHMEQRLWEELVTAYRSQQFFIWSLPWQHFNNRG